MTITELYDIEPKDNILVVASHPDTNFSQEDIIIAGAGGTIFNDTKELIKKHRCSYCGGNTADDQRGNCYACGAPRHENTESENGYFRLAF